MFCDLCLCYPISTQIIIFVFADILVFKHVIPQKLPINKIMHMRI